MNLTMMWLCDNDDDYDINGDNENYDDNENDMNDDDEDGDDDDDDPYKKVLVELNKPSFNTSSNIIMCSIIVIIYAFLKL